MLPKINNEGSAANYGAVEGGDLENNNGELDVAAGGTTRSRSGRLVRRGKIQSHGPSVQFYFYVYIGFQSQYKPYL